MSKTSIGYYKITNENSTCNIVCDIYGQNKPFESNSAYRSLEALYQGKRVLKYPSNKIGTYKKTKEIAQEIYENYEKKWCFICRWWDSIKQLFMQTDRGRIYDMYQKILAPNSDILEAKTKLEHPIDDAEVGTAPTKELEAEKELELKPKPVQEPKKQPEPELQQPPTPNPTKAPVVATLPQPPIEPVAPEKLPLTKENFNVIYKSVEKALLHHHTQEALKIANEVIFEKEGKISEKSKNLIITLILDEYFLLHQKIGDAILFVETLPITTSSKEEQEIVIASIRQLYFLRLICKNRLQQYDLEKAVEIVKKIPPEHVQDLIKEITLDCIQNQKFDLAQDLTPLISDLKERDSLLEKLVTEAARYKKDLVIGFWKTITSPELRSSALDKILNYCLLYDYCDYAQELITQADAIHPLGNKKKDYSKAIAIARFKKKQYDQAYELFKGLEGVDEYLKAIASHYCGETEEYKKAYPVILSIENEKERAYLLLLFVRSLVKVDLVQAEAIVNKDFGTIWEKDTGFLAILQNYLKDADVTEALAFIKRVNVSVPASAAASEKCKAKLIQDDLLIYAMSTLLQANRKADAQLLAGHISNMRKIDAVKMLAQSTA